MTRDDSDNSNKSIEICLEQVVTSSHC